MSETGFEGATTTKGSWGGEWPEHTVCHLGVQWMPVNTCLSMPVHTSSTWRGRWASQRVFLKVLKGKSSGEKMMERVPKSDSEMFVLLATSVRRIHVRDMSARAGTLCAAKRVLRLMWTPLRAAGCVYQWISTVPEANSAGFYTLTSINLLWPGLELHPPRGSNSLLPPPSLPLLPLSLSLYFPPFSVFPLSFSIHRPLPLSSPLPPSLFLYLTSSLH